jgi:integrase
MPPADAKPRTRPKLERTKVSGVFRRGDSYTYVWRDADGKQRWGTEATQAAARKAKARKESTPHYSSSVTAHDYLTEWVERYVGRTNRGFREETRDEYRRDLVNHVLPFLGKRVRIVDLRPRTISDLVSHLAHKPVSELSRRRRPGEAPRVLSDRSIRRILAPLKAAMATAVEEGLIPTNPCAGVKLPVRPQIQEDDEVKVKVLTNAELQLLLLETDDEWRDLLVFLVLTGLRISEALATRWQDLDLEGDQPIVRVRRRWRKGQMAAPKSRFGRRDVPLAPGAVAALRRIRDDAGAPKASALVWHDGNGAALNSSTLLDKTMKPAAAMAGVPWATFHNLRHTCASRLFAAGRNTVQVQRWLGHHSPAFTLETYVHLMDDDLGEPLDLPAAI